MSREPGPPADDAPKDFWDKFNIVLKGVLPVVGMVTVGLIGYYGKEYAAERQEKEAAVRLYSELMAQREQAESDLRKDMLSTVIQSFLRPDSEMAEGTGEGGGSVQGLDTEPLDKEILNLELLALNFHASLNLVPLFQGLEERIEARGKAAQAGKRPDSDEAQLEKVKAYRRRLHDVGREVAENQVATLEEVGEQRDMETLFLFREDGTITNFESVPPTAVMKVDGIERQFKVTPIRIDPNGHSRLRVRLESTRLEDSAQSEDDATFEIGYFDFPLVDNVRLSDDQRVAVVLDGLQTNRCPSEERNREIAELCRQPARLWDSYQTLNWHQSEPGHLQFEQHWGVCLDKGSLRDPGDKRCESALANLMEKYEPWRSGLSDRQWAEHRAWEEHGLLDRQQAYRGCVAVRDHRAWLKDRESLAELKESSDPATALKTELFRSSNRHRAAVEHQKTEGHRAFEQHETSRAHSQYKAHQEETAEHADWPGRELAVFRDLCSDEHLGAAEHSKSFDHGQFENAGGSKRRNQLGGAMARARIRLIYFPGSHAGFKDKPFYEDILKRLELDGSLAQRTTLPPPVSQ